MNSISQRDAFFGKVYEIAKDDRDVVVVSADMGAPALDKIRRDLASQFVNVGIAEQNAITLAAGLSMSGKKVFAYAIAPFITLRCLEQIRVENAIMKFPVTIVGVGVGFGYEDSGPTHHLIEDVAVMRALPQITIHTATDSVMAAAFAGISCKMKTPNYVRLDREALPDLYHNNSDFSSGLRVLKESKDCYIIANGNMTHIALDIVNRLKGRKSNIGVIDLHTIPINEALFLRTIRGIKKLISLEEHFLPGGLGSAVCEVLNDNKICIPVKRLGLTPDKGYCYKYGGREVIRKYYGLDRENLQKKITDFLR